jgi:hypothetical protein
MYSKIISFFYKYNQLCGMCPISLSLSQKEKNQSKNVMLGIWSIVNIAGVVLLFAMVLVNFSYFFTENQHPTIGSFNDILKFLTIFLTHIVILNECLVTRENYVEIEEKIQDTNQMLAGIGIDLKELQQSFCERFAKKFLLCFVISWAVEVKIIVGSLNNVQWTKIWFVTIISLMITRSRHLQHTFYIDNLAYRTKVIKKHLKQIVQKSMVQDYFQSAHHMDQVFGELKLTKNIYNNLWETAELINRSFGYSQLMNLMQNFIQLTCDLYWIYSVLYKNNFINVWGNFVISFFRFFDVLECLRGR